MSLEKRDDYFEPKSGILYSILGLLTFSTILPINIYTTIDDMAKMTWFWPFINCFIGILGFILSYFLYNILNLPALLVAAILFGFFTLINGCHHLDGLLDLSDAVMYQGTAEDKIRIMRDPITGTGAVSSLFIVGIIVIASYFTIISKNLLGLIIISEMACKIGLLSCCMISQSGPDGTGKPFIDYLTLPQFIVSVVLCGMISYLISPMYGVFGIIGGIVGGLITGIIAKKHVKIATGDVLGASNEIGRLFSLIFLVASLGI